MTTTTDGSSSGAVSRKGNSASNATGTGTGSTAGGTLVAAARDTDGMTAMERQRSSGEGGQDTAALREQWKLQQQQLMDEGAGNGSAAAASAEASHGAQSLTASITSRTALPDQLASASGPGGRGRARSAEVQEPSGIDTPESSAGAVRATLHQTRTWFGPSYRAPQGSSFYNRTWRSSGVGVGHGSDLEHSMGVHDGGDHLGFDFSAANTSSFFAAGKGRKAPGRGAGLGPGTGAGGVGPVAMSAGAMRGSRVKRAGLSRSASMGAMDVKGSGAGGGPATIPEVDEGDGGAAPSGRSSRQDHGHLDRSSRMSNSARAPSLRAFTEQVEMKAPLAKED